MSGAMNKQQKENAASALVEVCSVRVGETLFGVPISHILEIVGRTRPEPVPLAPEFVGGLIHYRGDALTTVSLRQLLDMPNLDAPQDIMVLESPAGCYGLLVDSVGEVLRVPASDHELNPSTLSEKSRALFSGTYKLKVPIKVHGAHKLRVRTMPRYYTVWAREYAKRVKVS